MEQVVPIVNNHKYSLYDKLPNQFKRRPMAIYIKIPEHRKKPEIRPAGSAERHIVSGENRLSVADAAG